MNRSQKIHNVDFALTLLINNGADFTCTPVYTSLEGPHVLIVTPQYEGRVNVEFEGSIHKLDTYGYVHRFADLHKFLEFFGQTVKAPSEPIAELAKRIGGKTMGDAVILRSDDISYYIYPSTNGGFMLLANNDKVFMSADDIALLLGA